MKSRNNQIPEDVANDWAMAEKHRPAIERILRDKGMDIIENDSGSDVEENFSFVIETQQGLVVIRVRRPQYRHIFDDITFRSWRDSGAETELDRILDGYGRWYLYAWESAWDDIEAWVLVNLDALRRSGLLRDSKTIFNADGTSGFIGITIFDLRAHGCLVAQKDTTPEAVQANEPDWVTVYSRLELSAESARLNRRVVESQIASYRKYLEESDPDTLRMWAQFYGVADIKQWAREKIDELMRGVDVLAERG